MTHFYNLQTCFLKFTYQSDFFPPTKPPSLSAPLQGLTGPHQAADHSDVETIQDFLQDPSSFLRNVEQQIFQPKSICNFKGE